MGIRPVQSTSPYCNKSNEMYKVFVVLALVAVSFVAARRRGDGGRGGGDRQAMMQQRMEMMLNSIESVNFPMAFHMLSKSLKHGPEECGGRRQLQRAIMQARQATYANGVPLVDSEGLPVPDASEDPCVGLVREAATCSLNALPELMVTKIQEGSTGMTLDELKSLVTETAVSKQCYGCDCRGQGRACMENRDFWVPAIPDTGFAQNVGDTTAPLEYVLSIFNQRQWRNQYRRRHGDPQAMMQMMCTDEMAQCMNDNFEADWRCWIHEDGLQAAAGVQAGFAAACNQQ